MLNETTTDIRNSIGITGTLNGPQGHVSAKKVGSVELIEWALQRLFSNLNDFNYQAANLLSCMTRIAIQLSILSRRTCLKWNTADHLA